MDSQAETQGSEPAPMECRSLIEEGCGHGQLERERMVTERSRVIPGVHSNTQTHVEMYSSYTTYMTACRLIQILQENMYQRPPTTQHVHLYIRPDRP